MEEKCLALIEAVLFLESEPLNIASISRITELQKEIVIDALDILKQRYSGPGIGIELNMFQEGYLLSPKQELWDKLRGRYGKKNDNKLSRAAMETLSIIAYSQPITKNEIQNIRGVVADSMIKILQDRKLIKIVGKKDIPGKPVQYGTSKEFLKYFKISSIAELPKLDELSKDKFEKHER